MSDLLNSASLVMIPSGYAEDKVYSVVPSDGSGDLSFTRASNGTRVNSAGVVEVAPWNLADDSNGFGGLSAITKTTGQVSPIDSTSGNLLTATGSGEHYSGTLALTAVVGNSYTYSAYGKFVQGVNIALRTVFSNGFEDISTIWNLSTGALVLNATNHTNPTITAVGNGYYRVSITYTPSTVPAFPLLFRLQMAVGTNLGFTASSGDGFLAYGAQINNGALKPYFPTTDRLNVPRLTYQNGGGGCPSLLLEKQSTNLVYYSEQFDNAAWVLDGNGVGQSVTANYSISPDGTQNADRIQLSRIGGTYSRIRQVVVAPSTGSISASIYLKTNDNTSKTLYFRLGSAGAEIITVTPNYQRFTITKSVTIGIAYDFELFIESPTDTTIDMSGWGAQYEQSSYPTSYIPTTSSSATRVADACFKTGISSLIGGGVGTWFMDFEMVQGAGSGNPFAFDLSDGSTSNRLFLYWSEGAQSWNWGGADVAITLPSTLRKKVAVKFSSGTGKLFCNGSLISTLSLSTAFSRLDIGQRFSSTFPMDGKINQAYFLTTSLTDAECEAITTI